MDLALAHLVEARLPGGDAAHASVGGEPVATGRALPRREGTTARPASARFGVDHAARRGLEADRRRAHGAGHARGSRADHRRRVFSGGGVERAARQTARRDRRIRLALCDRCRGHASYRGVSEPLRRAVAQRAGRRRAKSVDTSHAGNDSLPVPDTLLLNGGVFRAEALTQRLADTLGTWRGEPLNVLHNDNPDVAVARGAVAYCAGPRGQRAENRRRLAAQLLPRARRTPASASSDAEAAPRGICLLPRGTEEGHEILIADRTFALRLGHPVRFHLVSSSADTVYQPGELVDLAGGDFIRLPPIATVVQPHSERERARARNARCRSRPRSPKWARSRCTASNSTIPRNAGCSNSSCAATTAQVNLPGDDAPAARHPSLDDAIEQIDRCFGSRAQKVDPKEVKRLRAQLEQLLGPRDSWNSALLRELFGALWERARRRRRSADHERLWLESGRLLRAAGLRLSARRMARRATVVALRRRHPVRQRQPGLVRMVDAMAPRGRRPRRGVRNCACSMRWRICKPPRKRVTNCRSTSPKPVLPIWSG